MPSFEASKGQCNPQLTSMKWRLPLAILVESGVQ